MKKRGREPLFLCLERTRTTQDERQNAGRVNGQIQPWNALKRNFGTLHKAENSQIAQMQHERHASEEKQRRKNQPEALFYKRHL